MFGRREKREKSFHEGSTTVTERARTWRNRCRGLKKFFPTSHLLGKGDRVEGRVKNSSQTRSRGERERKMKIDQKTSIVERLNWVEVALVSRGKERVRGRWLTPIGKKPGSPLVSN